MRRIPRRTTFGLIAAFATIAALLPLVAVAFGVLQASTEQIQRRHVDALDAGARQIAVRLSRGLGEQWRELHAVLAFAREDIDGGPIRLRLDTAKALNDRLAWMGIARPDGRVLAGTGRVLEGQDVSARPWFGAGLQGAFAGDVHDAVLLARHLQRPEGAEPLRLIDFAAPIRRADGTVAGVVGSHVDWAWVRDTVRAAPLAPDHDALLVARDGTVLVGPAALEGRRLSQRAALAGGQATGLTTEEDWPDGRRYLARVVSAGAAGGGETPSFGWSIIVRQPSDAITALERDVARRVLVPAGLAALLVLAAGVLLARLLGRRAAALAATGAAIADGTLAHPVPADRLTREGAVLSAALARLDGIAAATTGQVHGAGRPAPAAQQREMA